VSRGAQGGVAVHVLGLMADASGFLSWFQMAAMADALHVLGRVARLMHCTCWAACQDMY
jgi:hypothetical protein